MVIVVDVDGARTIPVHDQEVPFIDAGATEEVRLLNWLGSISVIIPIPVQVPVFVRVIL
jgi:hypothetical protein